MDATTAKFLDDVAELLERDTLTDRDRVYLAGVTFVVRRTQTVTLAQRHAVDRIERGHPDGLILPSQRRTGGNRRWEGFEDRYR